MAKAKDKVMDFVAKELTKNPAAETSALFEKAKTLDPGIAELSLRQFNARYPLQVKRDRSPSKPGRKPKAASAAPQGRRRGATRAGRKAEKAASSETMRDVFLRFATDLTSAEERKDLVKVLAGIDRYVEDALAAERPRRRRS